MSRRRSLVLLGSGALLSLSVLGCRAAEVHSEHDDEHGDEHEHEHAEAEPHEAEHPEAVGQVRVEASMLRDLRLTLQAAHTRPAGEAVNVLGEIGVNEDAYAEVGSSIRARITRVLASVGEEVKQGQLLVELESADVGRSRAAVSATRARVSYAEKNLERRRGLLADGLVSEREVQASEAELAEAKAEDRAADESVRALGSAAGNGSRFGLRAPVAGTVLERNALLGRWVESTDALFVISDLTHPWLVVHAFERDALRMRVDSQVNVSFAALPGHVSVGQVKRVGSRVDPRSRTIDVRIDLQNADRILRPGMSASALVPIGDPAQAAIVVPLAAVQRNAEGWCVFLPTPDPGAFEVRRVGRGRELGGEVEIVSGLTLGERVVVDGAFLLKAEADKADGSGAEHHH